MLERKHPPELRVDPACLLSAMSKANSAEAEGQPFASPSGAVPVQSGSYIHRDGTREYMQAEVLPHVQQALEALVLKIQQERLKLAAGVEREDGQYLPHGWRPFCPHRWLAEYLIAHKPQPAAAAAAGQDSATAAAAGGLGS